MNNLQRIEISEKISALVVACRNAGIDVEAVINAIEKKVFPK